MHPKTIKTETIETEISSVSPNPLWNKINKWYCINDYSIFNNLWELRADEKPSVKADEPYVVSMGDFAVVKMHGAFLRDEDRAVELRGWGVPSISYEGLRDTIISLDMPIVLDINSPGGQASGCKRFCEFIAEQDVKLCYVRDIAASAAYFIAASSGAPIVAESDDSLVGCMGAKITHFVTGVDIVDKYSDAKSLQSQEGQDNMKENLTSMVDPLYNLADAGRSANFRTLKGARYTAVLAMEKKLNLIDGIENISGDGDASRTEMAGMMALVACSGNIHQINKINTEDNNMSKEYKVVDENKPTPKQNEVSLSDLQAELSSLRNTLTQPKTTTEVKTESEDVMKERARVCTLLATAGDSNKARERAFSAIKAGEDANIVIGEIVSLRVEEQIAQVKSPATKDNENKDETPNINATGEPQKEVKEDKADEIKKSVIASYQAKLDEQKARLLESGEVI